MDSVESSWYLGMLGSSGGCVAAQNSGFRPRKPNATRATNSTRPPSRSAGVILDFVVPRYTTCLSTVPSLS